VQNSRQEGAGALSLLGADVDTIFTYLEKRRKGANGARTSLGSAARTRLRKLQEFMDHFHYRDRVLFCEEIPTPTLAAAY
jgi:hypothetical protein